MNLSLWTWSDAPEQYQILSRHGGDEDWVLFAPNGAENKYWPVFLEEVLRGVEDDYLTGFGHIDRHILLDGILVIFAHA